MTDESTVSHQQNETAEDSSYKPDMSGSEEIAAGFTGESPLTQTEETPLVTDTSTPAEDKPELNLDEADRAAADELVPTHQESYDIPKEFYNEEGVLDEQAFLKDYHNKVKLAGKKGLTVPENVDGYSLAESEVFKEAEFDDEALQRTKEWALEQKLSPEQYTAAMEYWYTSMAEQEALENQRPELCTKELKEVWGADKYDDNIALAGIALREFGAGIPREGLQNNSDVIRLLANIGKELQEDTAPARTKSDGLLTEEEVDKIMGADDYWENGEKRQKIMDHYSVLEKKGKLPSQNRDF
jgi:uncharacterized LabA/DUF88 family protein